MLESLFQMKVRILRRSSFSLFFTLREKNRLVLRSMLTSVSAVVSGRIIEVLD